MKGKHKILNEFKNFIMRGNVMDLAVGVIIGGAFQKIVTSVVNDLFMPWIGLLTGGLNFADQFLVLKRPDAAAGLDITSLTMAQNLGVTTFNYGAFITSCIDFLIMGVIIFMMVRLINRLSGLVKEEQPEKEQEPTVKACPYCLSEIPVAATRCPHCTSEIGG